MSDHDYNGEKLFVDMVGRTIKGIELIKDAPVDNDCIKFNIDGKMYHMYHQQYCCESVNIKDIVGNFDDLVDSPLLQAEVVSSDQGAEDEYDESYTWTFYKLATIKGNVTISWYGSSDGYYSESVSFEEVK